jgi:hypothetical protein
MMGQEPGFGIRDSEKRRSLFVIPACFWRESSDFAFAVENQERKALDSRQKHAGMTQAGRDESRACNALRNFGSQMGLQPSGQAFFGELA